MARKPLFPNSKKRIAPFFRTTYSSGPEEIGKNGLLESFRNNGYMRNSRMTRLGCAALAAFLLCFTSFDVNGQSNELSTSNDTATDESNPAGVGNFTQLPFHVSASIRSGYDDNTLNTTNNRAGSAFTNESVSLSYDFGSPRTQIDLRTGAGIAYYFDRPGDTDYDVNALFGVTVAHKVSARFNLNASVYATYQAEPDFTLNAGLNRRSGNYFYMADTFSASYQWAPRFSTVTSYNLLRTAYDDAEIGVFQDRFEYTLGNQFRFLIWPTTSLIAEYRFQIIDYDSFPRNSTSHFLLGGLDHTFNPHFNISARGGAEFRSFTDTGTSTIDPYLEGTLTYALGARSSLTLTSHYGLEEPDVPGSFSRTTFRTGVQAQYRVTPRILTSLSFYYEHDDNNAGVNFFGFNQAFAEDSITVSLAGRFAINHTWAVDAGYDFSDVESELFFRSYYRNRFSAGLNVSF